MQQDAGVHKTCQSCGSHNPRWTPRYPKLSLFTCTDCDSFTYFSENTVNADELYSKEYFNGGEYRDYVGHRAIHEINFQKKWDILKRYLPQPVRLFEQGCAYGLFVEFAKKSGAEKVFGADISRDAIDYAQKNFGPHFEIASDQTKPPFSYNCLVAWDVWEHLEKPFNFFSTYVEGLEKGGIVAVTTVDSSSMVARLRGERWRQIHPPTHLHYPTKQGIKKAMEALGLEVVYHSYIGYRRALESYLAPFGLDSLVKKYDGIRNLPILLDLRDIQLIVARKTK